MFASFSHCRLPSFYLSPAMALPQPIVVLEPLPWTQSTVTLFALNELVNGGLLAPASEGAYPAWDGPAGVRLGAQPTVQVRCQLHPAA
jgi:hypothetical protein